MRKINLYTIFKLPEVNGVLGNGSRWNSIIRIVLITLLTWGLSHLVIYDLESIIAFASSEKRGDFEISDVYNAIADRRNVSQLSPYVTIVAVDDCSRQEVMDVLDIVAEYEPSVVGLDIFFRKPNNDSVEIVNRFKSIQNLVLPTILTRQPHGEYVRMPYSFVEESLETDYAYVNLNAATVVDVVRDFTPAQQLAGGDSVWNIAAKMAQVAYPEKFRILQQRNNSTEIIQFASVDVHILHAHEILSLDNDDYLMRYLNGRAVLIGDVMNLNDKYSIPLNGLMPGVAIHAHALHTIVAETYTTVSPMWLNWLIALIVCFVFLLVNEKVKHMWSNVGNMVMRLLQVALMFSMVYIGSYWYVAHLQYIDFSPIILMLGFSSLASDIYDGMYAIYIRIRKSKKQE